MHTFFMFGRYSAGSLEHVSPERTRLAHEVVEQLGGRMQGVYALMGEYDGVLITEFARMADAMKATVELKRRLDISFFTSAAMPIEEFDQLVGEM
jgi:uncharacterized protein with GYD domain